MANPAHLLRRQSSRDLVHQRSKQKSFDQVELRELRNRLQRQQYGSHGSLYGALNQGFQGDYNNELTIGAISMSSGHHPILSSLFETPDSNHLLTNEDEVIKEEDETAEEEKVEEIIQAEEERGSWDSKLTFLLATIGYAVGLGNVWRFPYLAQKNGGGAFLVPYFIMLFVQGIPIFYLELAIGQRLRKGAIGVWQQVNPYLAGIGISSAVVSYIVALYYNTIISWCVIYLFHSVESPLPWAECPKRFYPNNMTYDYEPECVVSSPTQYYWYRSTLQSSSSVNEPEIFNWNVALALIAAWFLIYMCMVRGITESGKVVYITAIFPYIVLIIFFFRGITLKGASDGLAHLFTPRWERLADPVVWLEAGTQIFFSLGLAFGGLIAFSSYNPANNNCYRDALLVSFTNCGTSMFAGVVVFSIIGFKATATYDGCLAARAALVLQNATGMILPECDLQKELDNSASGTGLAFIIFTEAINQFPGAQLWAVLFFLMLFTLGVDSQFGTLEGVATSLVDMKLFPKANKEMITGGLCLSCCIISMIFANGAGSYIFQLMDSFAGNYTLLIIAFCECISISYIYGIKRFADDIELMTGKRPALYWMICWKYVSPACMLVILSASFIDLAIRGSSYPAWDGSGVTVNREWPHWCIVMAILLISVSILWIPLVAICRLMGINIVEDREPAAFPIEELREVHGIVPVEPTSIERSLFCIKDDGTEGLCCPTYYVPEKTLEEEEE